MVTPLMSVNSKLLFVTQKQRRMSLVNKMVLVILRDLVHLCKEANQW